MSMIKNKNNSSQTKMLNEATKFLDTKLFKDVTQESSNKLGEIQEVDKASSINREYSIADIIQVSKEMIEEKVFLITDSC